MLKRKPFEQIKKLRFLRNKKTNVAWCFISGL